MYKNFRISEDEKKEILEMHQSHGYSVPKKIVITETQLKTIVNKIMSEQARQGYKPSQMSQYTFKDEASFNAYNKIPKFTPQAAWVNMYGETISGYNKDTKAFNAAPEFIANIVMNVAMFSGNKKNITAYGTWGTFKTYLTKYITEINKISPAKVSGRYSPLTIVETIEKVKAQALKARDEAGKDLGVTKWQKFITDVVQPYWLSMYQANVIPPAPTAEPVKKP